MLSGDNINCPPSGGRCKASNPKLTAVPGLEPINSVSLPGEDTSRQKLVVGNRDQKGNAPLYLVTPFREGHRVQQLLKPEKAAHWRKAHKKHFPDAKSA